MPENTLSAIDVPCELWGGLNTELSPPDIPEGVSPENQDVAFLPGSVQRRPALKKQLTVAAAGTAIVYIKTFIQPNGEPLTLFLDSSGSLHREDVNANPGHYTLLTSQNTIGGYALSVSAFGREYIAFSDGIHGQDIPRQYDGTFIDRVTQDAPGQGPSSMQDYSASVAILSITPVVTSVVITSAVETDNLATITTNTPHGMFPGDSVSVSTPLAGFNGTFVVAQATSLTFSYVVGTTGLAPQSSGTAYPLKVRVFTSTPHGLLLFDQFTIAGNSVTLYNNGKTAGGVNSPPNWVVTDVTDPQTFYFTAVSTTAGPGTGGTLAAGGKVDAGPRKFVLLYQLRDGSITAPSPPVSFTGSGGKRIAANNFPSPPVNTVAWILAFTLSDGGSYFYLPVPAQGVANNGNLQNISTSTVIPLGSSAPVLLDFSDTILAGGIAIDIPGNNLFAQVRLAPVLGFTAYASRLVAWGEWNDVKNLLNMGFDGGSVSGTPTGWITNSPGGLVTNGEINAGNYTVGQYVITSTSGGANSGLISQNAAIDAFGQAILQPNTQYSVRLWASKPNVTYDTGVITVVLTDFPTGFVTQVSFPMANVSVNGGWLMTNFPLKTPAMIPPNLTLKVYAQIPAGNSVTIDELMIVYTDQPYRETLCRVSYVNNPQGFDGVTGLLGSASDTSPVKCFSTLRDLLYLKTSSGFHRTQDSGSGEPNTWDVREVSRRVGAVSFRAGDPGQYGTGDTGEGWDLTFSRSGFYMFQGGELYKISQEVQDVVDAINWEVEHTIWIKNDTVTRRAYVGIPYGDAKSPNMILVMDYRDMNMPYAIANGDPVHISYSGKMISSDLTRKWTTWNLPMSCGELLVRPNNVITFCMGAGNGQPPGQGNPPGNFYSLTYDGYAGGGTVTITPLASSLNNPWPALPSQAFQNEMGFDLEWPLNVSTERCAFKLQITNVGSDDDYGPILPSYTTYFFVNHDAEMQLGTGSHRKLFYYLSLYISGLASIQKMVVSVKQHPMSPVRGYL